MTGEEEKAAEIMACAAEGAIEMIKTIRSAVCGEDRLGDAPDKRRR